MPDFLLELLTEEIPARMQAKAAEQLGVRFGDGIKGKLPGGEIRTLVTPRRLILYATGLGAQGNAAEEERRGPRADAPPQAIEGFLRSTELARDELEERDTPKGKFLYATIRTEGRSAAAVIADLIPVIVRDFDWPKSMRWGDASLSTASPRWVRPLSGIVALLDDAVVAFEAAGIASGRTTFGHRFMSSGPIEIASAATYADQLRAAKVMIDPAERAAVILDGARAAASARDLALIDDAGLVAENAGLTEWPVPLLGHFDSAFLDVPREVIQLTMRTNQKYFAATDAQGRLAPAFVCVANLEASDGGAAIVAGNRKVLAARLADAKFFWDQDRAIKLKDRLPKLAQIVFHEKLGTVADKVERVAKLARWLVESGAVLPSPLEGEGQVASSRDQGEGARALLPESAGTPLPAALSRESPSPSRGEGAVARLADLAETAARLCKADLVSATVGEFPEVQGIAGGYLALAEGLDPQIAAAIRDHYKPVGPTDEVPTAPVSVAVALSDKLDTLAGFFGIGSLPTGSKDPFALRRAMLAVIQLVVRNDIRFRLTEVLADLNAMYLAQAAAQNRLFTYDGGTISDQLITSSFDQNEEEVWITTDWFVKFGRPRDPYYGTDDEMAFLNEPDAPYKWPSYGDIQETYYQFIADRIVAQQKAAGIRSDLISAVYALGGQDDLVRLLARVRALQAFLATPDGTNLLAGYKRAANILRIEEAKGETFADPVDPAQLVEPAEIALNVALDIALPDVTAAIAAEDFTAAMRALSTLRPAVDAFFVAVIVNAADLRLRTNRLNLLNRLREAVHTVADFARIEG